MERKCEKTATQRNKKNLKKKIENGFLLFKNCFLIFTRKNNIQRKPIIKENNNRDDGDDDGFCGGTQKKSTNKILCMVSDVNISRTLRIV